MSDGIEWRRSVSAVTPISSSHDPRLEPFRRLKGQGRRPDGTFVAESELVLERLVASSILIRSVLLTQPRYERLVCQPFWRHDVDVVVAPQEIIDDVVGYPLHRGVVAVAERPPARAAADIVVGTRTVIVLEQVMDPENVGSVFRHAAGFGAEAVVLVGGTGDPLYRKTIRTSMGWTLEIAFAEVCDAATLQQLLGQSGFVSMALTPNPEAEPLADAVASVSAETPVALWLGAEGPGLTERALGAPNRRVRIPLVTGVDSLNVATAAAIALYALTTAHPNRIVPRASPPNL